MNNNNEDRNVVGGLLKSSKCEKNIYLAIPSPAHHYAGDKERTYKKQLSHLQHMMDLELILLSEVIERQRSCDITNMCNVKK